jgi:hypothetical protein
MVVLLHRIFYCLVAAEFKKYVSLYFCTLQLKLHEEIGNIKGIVQRKIRWVESGVNQWVMLQYWGAGHYFFILKGHHLVFSIKRFAAI